MPPKPPEPNNEERMAASIVLDALKDLTPAGRDRVLKTAEAFYGKQRLTRG